MAVAAGSFDRCMNLLNQQWRQNVYSLPAMLSHDSFTQGAEGFEFPPV